MVTTADNIICHAVIVAIQRILRSIVKRDGLLQREHLLDIKYDGEEDLGCGDKGHNPQLFRLVAGIVNAHRESDTHNDDDNCIFGCDYIYHDVDYLMMNNLTLDNSGYGAGEGPFNHYLLCAAVSNENLPWDLGN